MVLYFFQKLVFRNDAFFDATNLVSHDIVRYWSDNNVIIVQLLACAIFAIFQNKSCQSRE